MTVEKPKPKQLLRPVTTGADSAMNQSQFLAIICNSLKAREESRVHDAIGFGFSSHWLKNWRDSFKPITKAEQFALFTRRPYCPGGPKKLCFTTLSYIPMVSIARLSVVKQSSFGLPVQYGRRVTRVNCNHVITFDSHLKPAL